MYANFIDGLAQELKARGLGICIGGQRIPLLMYADDIVMLAATQQELMLMNRIASPTSSVPVQRRKERDHAV